MRNLNWVLLALVFFYCTLAASVLLGLGIDPEGSGMSAPAQYVTGVVAAGGVMLSFVVVALAWKREP